MGEVVGGLQQPHRAGVGPVGGVQVLVGWGTVGGNAMTEMLSSSLQKQIVCAGEGTRMRDRQQVNNGKDQHHTHTHTAAENRRDASAFFYVSSSFRATRPIFQRPQLGWGHWKGPAMLGLAVFDIIEKM